MNDEPPGPLSRQPPCPDRLCGGLLHHEHHTFFPCDRCGCTTADPFGVIDGQ